MVVVALAIVATIALLDNSTLRSQVAAANTRADNAVSVAQAAAKKDYEAQHRVDQEAARLNQQSQTIAAQIGELKANTIKAAGLYVVGHDIKAGTWHTTGDGKVDGGLCSYWVYSSVNKPGYTMRLDGPTTVDLSGAYAFIDRGALHMGARAIVTGRRSATRRVEATADGARTAAPGHGDADGLHRAVFSPWSVSPASMSTWSSGSPQTVQRPVPRGVSATSATSATSQVRGKAR